MEESHVENLRRPLGELPDPLPIPPIRVGGGRAPVLATIRPPGSKSLTNRALLLAGLASGVSTIRHPLLEADDAKQMLEALQTLGVKIDRQGADEIRVHGVGGAWKTPPEGVALSLGNAGTATRFLAASALLSPGPLTIDGNDRMRQRPIGELLDAIRALGAEVEELGEPGCPPVKISPPKESPPSQPILKFGQTRSSQYISALAMVGSCLEGGLTLDLGPEPTSASYIAMTVRLLDQIGVNVRTSEQNRVIRVLPGLDPFSLEIEPDASGATYFWAAGVLVPGSRVRVQGLDSRSLQGDVGFAELLARLGAVVRRSEDEHERWIDCSGPESLKPIIADMTNMPDAVMTLTSCCAFATGTSILRGVRTLRFKECDRIRALEVELAKIGVRVECDVNTDPDTMTISPPTKQDRGESGFWENPVVFETYDDHRMAMSLALIGLRRPNVAISNPRCVEKTYPGFWQDLARLYE